MRKAMFVCGVATFAATAAMLFPGGSGAHGSLSLRKLPALKKEPSAVSKQPLNSEIAQ